MLQLFFLSLLISFISGCNGSNTFSTDINTDTNTNTQEVLIDFQNDIMPLLEAKCLRCHGETGNFHITTPSETYALLLYDAPRQSTGYENFIIKNNLEKSLLYKKALNLELHGGGAIFSYDSDDALLLKKWIVDSAIYNREENGY